MSERKLDQIETMFKKTAKPKLNIEEIQKIEKIAVILDDTPQGKIALEIATLLSNKVGANLDVIVSEEYYETFHTMMEGIDDEINDLIDYANEKIDELKLYAKVDTVVSTKVRNALEIYEQEIEEKDKLGEKLVEKLREKESDLVILGVPLFQGREESEAENLGAYATKLLRERRIHSNFLLVSDLTKPEVLDTILSFVSIEQQPGSMVALTKRALSLSTEKTEINTVGMILDKVIETVARVDQPVDELDMPEVESNETAVDEDLDLRGAEGRLVKKMQETLDSIKINEDIVFGSFKGEVKTGSVASIVNTSLEDKQPGLVMVRSVAEIAENLDPFAIQITRIILKSGYPCLIVWD